MNETPWVAVRDVCGMYGYTYGTAKGKIQNETFPVPTYKVGRTPVIDREVHDEYFRRKKQEGINGLNAGLSHAR